MSFRAGILEQSQLLHLKLVLATLKHTFCLMARCKCRAPDFPEGYQGTGGAGLVPKSRAGQHCISRGTGAIRRICGPESREADPVISPVLWTEKEVP